MKKKMLTMSFLVLSNWRICGLDYWSPSSESKYQVTLKSSLKNQIFYYKWNVCVTPKLICWSSTPQCDTIWKWSLGSYLGLDEVTGRPGRELLSGTKSRQHLDLGLPSPQNSEKINFCCSSHLVCDILL